LAIIVDKEQKKKAIALKAKSLILQKGINNITIAQIAQEAEIGKGTVYEYFKNKEEIVFELVEILMQEHNEKKAKKLALYTTTREKVKSFFSFFYIEEDKELRNIYQQFTSIALAKQEKDMIAFQTQCYLLYKKWMEDIIDEGIKKEQLNPQIKELIIGIFSFAQGAFIMSVMTNAIANLQQTIDHQIDILFDTMEKK